MEAFKDFFFGGGGGLKVWKRGSRRELGVASRAELQPLGLGMYP